MRAAVGIIKKEWLSLEEAVAMLGKSAKSLERLDKAGQLRTRLESREGRKASRLYHAGDLDRIKTEAIPASKVEPAVGRTSKQLAVSKPMGLALTNQTVGALEKLLDAWVRHHDDGMIGEKMWLTWSEASQRSGIPLKALRSLCLDGRIHAQQFGRSWRVSRRSLESFEGTI